MPSDHIGFNGDFFIKERIQELIDIFEIQAGIETGTYLGETTAELAQILPTVHSIEISPTSHLQAKRNLDELNLSDKVSLHLGNSPEVLGQILGSIDGPILFYLDAHWQKYWPLQDELKAIAKLRKGKDVIVIHDFFVPGSGLGYDSYLRVNFPALKILEKVIRHTFGPHLSETLFKDRLDWNYISSFVEKIYGANRFELTTNFREKATGSMRGVAYITPKL